VICVTAIGTSRHFAARQQFGPFSQRSGHRVGLMSTRPSRQGAAKDMRQKLAPADNKVFWSEATSMRLELRHPVRRGARSFQLAQRHRDGVATGRIPGAIAKRSRTGGGR
jgi:hypothetical protein